MSRLKWKMRRFYFHPFVFPDDGRNDACSRYGWWDESLQQPKGKCILKGAECEVDKGVVSEAKVTLELSLKGGVRFPRVDV